MKEQEYSIREFWENGFCIIRGVFTAEEVARWRRFGQGFAYRDMFSHNHLRDIILDPRTVEIARAILDSPALVYFGDSNAMVGKTDSGFHKDNADKENARAPDWNGAYPIIRFGLYTDDHTDHSGGLDLRKGSHRTVSVTQGEYVAARTKPGDVVVWNLRTSHSGGTMLLRNGTALDPASIAGKIVRRMPPGLVTLPEHAERIGLFWTLGLAGPHLDRYIAYLKTRRYAVERCLEADYAPEAVEAARKIGMVVRAVRSELVQDDLGPLHETHVSLPFDEIPTTA